MKKIIAFMLICILLMAMLAGCSKDTPAASQQVVNANFQPETTALPNATAMITSAEAPTQASSTDAPLEAPIDATATPNAAMLAGMDEDEPETTPEPTDAPEAPEATATAASPYLGYNYAQLNGDAFGFTMSYPTSWVNLPGKYTACYQEQVVNGDFPARVAVTSKRLAHKPEDSTVVKQFQSFAKQIYSGYDPETFEFGELNSKTTFMGRSGHSITYLAYSGETEVKGYMCCCAIDYTIYVFHFYSSYDDFDDLNSVMTRIRDSVAVAK